MNQRSSASPPVASAIVKAQFALRPIDRLIGFYAAVSGVALLFPHHPRAWPALLALHGLVALLAFRPRLIKPFLARISRTAPRFSTLVADWYPILLVPALYSELQPLNAAIYNGYYFDSYILAIEHAVFGAPSQTLAYQYPTLWASELLHACYMSYYLMIFGFPIVIYVRCSREVFAQMVFTMMLTFVAHYVFFIFFPVQGPRYLFPAPGGPIAQGSLYQLTHKALEAGSSRGAAFPSSHVGVAVVQVVNAVRYMPALSPVIAFAALGLALGAIYGGFHYATDAVCGLILGFAVALIAPRVRAWMQK